MTNYWQMLNSGLVAAPFADHDELGTNASFWGDLARGLSLGDVSVNCAVFRYDAGLFVSAALAGRNFATLNPPHARKDGLARVLLRLPASITNMQFNSFRASDMLF